MCTGYLHPSMAIMHRENCHRSGLTDNYGFNKLLLFKYLLYTPVC